MNRVVKAERQSLSNDNLNDTNVTYTGFFAGRMRSSSLSELEGTHIDDQFQVVPGPVDPFPVPTTTVGAVTKLQETVKQYTGEVNRRAGVNFAFAHVLQFKENMIKEQKKLIENQEKVIKEQKKLIEDHEKVRKDQNELVQAIEEQLQESERKIVEKDQRLFALEVQLEEIKEIVQALL